MFNENYIQLSKQIVDPHEDSALHLQFSGDVLDGSIVDRLEHVVSRCPTNLAYRDDVIQLTYSEFNQRTNQHAHALLEKRGAESEPVALVFGFTVSAIISMFATMKAGKFYIALDTSHPLAHNQAILKDSGAQVVITDDASVEAARKIGPNAVIISIDHLSSDLPTVNPGIPLTAMNMAALMYTSGSTGEPKGVCYTHHSFLVRCIHDAIDLPIYTTDRVAQLFTYGFAATRNSIYNALMNGAALCAYDVRRLGISPMAWWLISEQISILPINPTLLRHFMINRQSRLEQAHVRFLILGGEPLTQRDHSLFCQVFPPGAIMLNRYSSTEGGMMTENRITHESATSEAILPVGTPQRLVKLMVLDDDRKPAAAGIQGEIAVMTPSLALYWQDDALNSQKFISSPAGEGTAFLTGDLGFIRDDGVLEHLGRIDRQVKIRGYRVETSVIEMALLALPVIKDAAVIDYQDESGEKKLAAYLVSTDGKPLAVDFIRPQLAKSLPDYMIPSFFTMIDALPLTTTGKLNREALPSPAEIRPQMGSDAIAPRNRVEEKVAKIWEGVLKLRAVGVTDDFFELGGTSLLAATILIRVEEEFGLRLPLSVFLEKAPTVENLAIAITGARKMVSIPTVIRLKSTGSFPPLFCVHGKTGNVMIFRDLSALMSDEQPFYAIQAPAMDSEKETFIPMEELAARYIEAIRAVQPSGPYFLMGYSSGGVIAFEMAQQLTNSGEKVAQLVLLDSFFPRLHPRLTPGQMLRRMVRGLKQTARNQLYAIRQKRPASRPYYYARLIFRLFKQALGSGPGLAADIVSKVTTRAIRAYYPETYEGNLVFIFAPMNAKQQLKPDTSSEAWRSVTGGEFEMITVRGAHKSMLRPPHVEVLAEKLEEALAAAREELKS